MLQPMKTITSRNEMQQPTQQQMQSPLQHVGAAYAAGRVEPPQAPSTASSPALGARALLASGRQGVVGRMPGPKADTD